MIRHALAVEAPRVGARGQASRLPDYSLYLQENSKNMLTKDSNGTRLSYGDSVTVIKDLKVGGSSSDIKRGTMMKNIKLADDEGEIEGCVDKSAIGLITMF
jgi:protein PhnA